MTLSGAITGAEGPLFKTGLGTLRLETAVGTGMDTVNASAGTTNFGVSQTLAALNIAADATVVLDDSAPAPEAMASVTQAIPEPATLSMLLAGLLAVISHGSARNRLMKAERSGKLPQTQSRN